MRIVPIKCIPDGSVLAKTIYNNQGILLLKKGTKLNSSILKRISRYEISSLYIFDDYSKNEIEHIIKPELREKTILALKETFSYITSLYDNELIGKKVYTKNDEYLNNIKLLAEDILDNILNNDNILVNLIDIKKLDNSTYEHSVNVAVLSIVIGIGLNLDKDSLIKLSIGALLHDVGKTFIPKEIINKKGPLTDDEYSIIKNHPKLGYDYLKENFDLDLSSLSIILEHHERINGSGYPLQLSGDEIGLLSKIVSVADVYDALTSDRSYKRAFSASDSLEFIMANSNTMFDYEIVSVFSRLIIPFPFGTVVSLSNGDIGIVQDTPTNFPLRPNIKIIKSCNKDVIGTSISLINELSLVISEVKG